MVRKPKGKGRGISLTSLLMLGLTAAVLIVGVGVVGRLKNANATLNIGRLAEELTDDWSLSLNELPTPGATRTAEPAAALLQPVSTAGPTATEKPAAARTVTMTLGGTFAVQSDVRQSCYYSATGSYDFGELFSLISGRLDGDLTSVALENLVSGRKYSDLLAPAEALSGLRGSGVGLVTLGFPKCLDKGGTVLQTTVKEAQSAGLMTAGAFLSESDATVRQQLLEVNGVQVAFLHYTDGLSATSLKKLKNAGISWAVSVTDQAAEEIAQAKQLGAELVIVSVSWSKSVKSVSSAQRTLAQSLTEAGADVIIGTGTRTVLPAEWLTATDGSRALCCYGLGTMISESRTDEGVAGILLHLSFAENGAGGLALSDAAYTPTYIWHYKQDGAYHFRMVNAAGEVPDGMDSTQQRSMASCLKRIQSRLGDDTPLRLRED